MYNGFGMAQNTFFSPFQQSFQQPLQQQQQIVKVNGANGANAYPIAPNSTALLLDETAPIVWLVSSDGAGYKTCTAYDISPHVDSAQAHAANLEARIKRLEDIINGKSDTRQDNGAERIKPADDSAN